MTATESAPVAVLMSVYADERTDFFRQAMTSIRDQTYPAVDLHLFLDGPLPRALAAVVSEFEQSFDRLHVYSHPVRRGLVFCLNDLITTTRDRYRYFARMDSDDVSRKDRIDLQVEFMEAHPDVDVVGTWTIDIDEIGRELKRVRYPLGHDDLVRFFAKRTLLAHGTVMFRSRYFERAGLYPPVAGVEDELYWMRGLLSGCRFRVLPEYLVCGRRTEDFWRRRSELRRALAEFRTRCIIIRKLRYGVLAWVYAVGLLAVRLAPVPVKRLLYRYLR